MKPPKQRVVDLFADNKAIPVSETFVNQNDCHEVRNVGQTSSTDGATSSFLNQSNTTHFVPESCAPSAMDTECLPQEDTVNEQSDDDNHFETEECDPSLLLECSSEPECDSEGAVIEEDNTKSNNDKPIRNRRGRPPNSDRVPKTKNDDRTYKTEYKPLSLIHI